MSVVISRVGVVSPYGVGLDALHRGLLSGAREFRDWPLLASVGAKPQPVAMVSAPLGLDKGSRSTRLARAAVASAIAREEFGLREFGLIVGGTTGGMAASEECYLAPQPRGLAGFDAASAAAHPVSETAALLGDELGLDGPRTTVVSACSSGLAAVIVAKQWIEAGLCEGVIAIGADALCRLTAVGFASLGAVDSEGTRPFQAGRKGITLGEGAAAFLIEREASARRAGRAPLARVMGGAIAGEAYHATQPDPSGAGAVAVMQGALTAAGIAAADVQLVSAHGTGTPQNDAMECQAAARLFGRVTLTAQKSQLGHTLGAAGAIELAAAVAMLRHQVAYATYGLDAQNLDPACAEVDHVIGQARAMKIDHVLKNSFAFGGQNAAVVLGRAEVDAGARP